MAELILYAGNDSVLELQTKDAINSSDLSSAAVTYILKNDSNTILDSGPMTYIELTSAGYYKFRATLADTLNITAGNKYIAVIDSDSGIGKRGNWSPNIIAEKRI